MVFTPSGSEGTAAVRSSGGTTRITLPNDRYFPADKEKPLKNPHEKGSRTFARIYANEAAAAEIAKDAPDFPVGSIIAREKLLQETDETPQVVTAMFKREKGFSPKTGDWEFFVFGGADLKIQKRETKGDCAKCHAGAEKTDWVFRDYLK